MKQLLLLSIICLPMIASGCRSGEPTSSKKNGNKYLKCAGAGDDGVKEEISIPPLKLTRKGSTMEIKGVDSSVVTLGVLSGLNAPDAGTLSNIRYFLEQFKGARVQAIVVAGGLGGSKKDMLRLLEALAQAPVPILASPGAQENYTTLRGAIKESRLRFPQLVDMTLVRKVSLRHVSILSLPGYFNAFYLEAAEQGCSYDKEDLETLAGLIDKNQTTVLLSATPPRGQGPNAVDSGRGNVNIGDPALYAMMVESGIRFGLFGHVHESGGNVTTGDGKTPVAKGVWHDSLFLQAGAADAVPVPLSRGGQSSGMAHIVDFSGDRSRFRTLVAP